MIRPIPLAMDSQTLDVIAMDAAMGNRHGLITGATGTGKTLSLQLLAEGFALQGTHVLVTDLKGDLSGLAAPGQLSDKLSQRLARVGISDWKSKTFTVHFWDVFGKDGVALRATPSDMGPLLLARLLELNDTQTGVLQMLFRIADDQGLLLLDLKDLKAMLSHLANEGKNYIQDYGHFSVASVGAIQRRLLAFEDEGGGVFLGEPMLDIADLLTPNPSGLGSIHLLQGVGLMRQPKLYATALVWLLAELYENLAEVGDADHPKLVLFFDEAHLLFDDAPPVLVDKIEQVVRLIRSKGVGLYFVSQSPQDIPDAILAQLGNRIQHALRAYTPRDQQALKAAAQSLRQRPGLNTLEVLPELAVGEALVSFLDSEGRPQPVSRAWMRAPQSQIGPIDDGLRQRLWQESPWAAKYQAQVDRYSAFEALQSGSVMAQQNPESDSKAQAPAGKSLWGNLAISLGKSLASSIGRQLGREIMRGILGSSRGRRR